ncbi:MAG: hypothetical protein ACK5QX_01205, partial [bacterium]
VVTLDGHVLHLRLAVVDSPLHDRDLGGRVFGVAVGARGLEVALAIRLAVEVQDSHAKSPIAPGDA